MRVRAGRGGPREGERMKKKILCVDDSRTALFMVTTILKKEPY